MRNRTVGTATLLLEPLEERCLLTAFALVQNLGYMSGRGPEIGSGDFAFKEFPRR